jgi:hypothetical protein
MDPRIKTPATELREQFAMETGAARGMNESYKSLSQVRSVREQLAEAAKKAGPGALTDSIAAVDKKTAALEGAAQSSFYGVPASGKQPENFSSLNQHFGALLAVADSSDSTPTVQAQAVYKELQKALEELEAKWFTIRSQDLAELNKSLAQANQPKIEVERPLPAPLAADAKATTNRKAIGEERR